METKVPSLDGFHYHVLLMSPSTAKLPEKGQNGAFDEFRRPKGAGRVALLEVLPLDRLYLMEW